jgi:hypothetical protein
MAAPLLSINTSGPVNSLYRDYPNRLLKCYYSAAASEGAPVWAPATSDS